MGTRSYIALQIEEDEYLTIFCHYNGYPDDNGAILAEHYDKQEKVESLIQLGDLYFLRSKLEPNPDLPHNHSTPQPNVTIAYNRDEGWSDCEAVHKTLDELNDPGEIGIEFTYIFTFEGRWIYFPTGEAELGFRDVKEDLDNDTVQYGSFFTEHENNMDWPDMREWLGTSEVDLSVFDLQDLNFRLKKLPRIFRDLYEYDYPPTKHSIDLLDRKYCKTN